MTSARISLVLAAVTAAGCGPAAEEPTLYLSPDRSSFDGRSERVIVKVRAFEVGGMPAGGVVRLTAPVGHFVGGDEVVLSDGFATATYACSPEEEAACEGTVRLAGAWGGLSASTQVSITPALNLAPVEWEVVPTHSLASLLAIAPAADGSAWAVGERGTVLHLVGRRWLGVPSPVRSTLRAVAMDADGDPVIVGDEGVVLRLVAGALQRLPFPARESFTAVAIDARGQVLLGAASGVLSTIVGEELQAQLELRTPILAMARQSEEVWATGDGVLARFASTQWLNLPMPVAARLTVAQTGREGLWLGGEREGATAVSGVIVTGPSPSWRTTALPEPVRAFAEVPGEAERFALTSQHLYRQLGDGKWDQVTVPSAAAAMASRTHGDLVLVGPPGISLLRAP